MRFPPLFFLFIIIMQPLCVTIHFVTEQRNTNRTPMKIFPVAYSAHTQKYKKSRTIGTQSSSTANIDVEVYVSGSYECDPYYDEDFGRRRWITYNEYLSHVDRWYRNNFEGVAIDVYIAFYEHYCSYQQNGITVYSTLIIDYEAVIDSDTYIRSMLLFRKSEKRWLVLTMTSECIGTEEYM